jgi:hypothetical protein
MSIYEQAELGNFSFRQMFLRKYLKNQNIGSSHSPGPQPRAVLRRGDGRVPERRLAGGVRGSPRHHLRHRRPHAAPGLQGSILQNSISAEKFTDKVSS